MGRKRKLTPADKGVLIASNLVQREQKAMKPLAKPTQFVWVYELAIYSFDLVVEVAFNHEPTREQVSEAVQMAYGNVIRPAHRQLLMDNLAAFTFPMASRILPPMGMAQVAWELNAQPFGHCACKVYPVFDGRKSDKPHDPEVAERLDDVRRQKADKVFSEYDFGDEVVKDSDGWRQDEADVLNCSVYFERGDEASERRTFYVRFQRNTATVVSMGLDTFPC